MGTAASSFPDPVATEHDGRRTGLAVPKAARRAKQRRKTLAVQVLSYALGAASLFIYAHVGTISMWIPPAFFLSGATLIGMFAVVSEIHVNDRFEDHYLALIQLGSHVTVQLGFLLWAPEVGYAFLNVLFLIFAVASLRITWLQAAIAWTFTTAGVVTIFLIARVPIGLSVENTTERFAAAFCFIATIGQCAFVGLYGDSLRKRLYKRGLELIEANKRIEELAELDELTGAFNRRCIMRTLNDEIDRARRNDTSCSIVLIDLDWFKRINDAYGHPAGDDVLRTFAITMFANVRAIDRFGRYGGEEFLLVLPDMPEDAAVRAADRLRAIVADLDWSALSAGMKVTISAGVATFKSYETADTFLARADSALYAAKAQGRNRIASA